MTSRRVVLLDPGADNDPRQYPSHVVIENDVGLVEHAFDGSPLIVQGEWLCRWAEDFGAGRGWEMTRLSSPTKELADLCPALSSDELRVLIGTLAGRLPRLRRPLELPQVLTTLLGDQALWEPDPGPHHAHHWLGWLSGQTDSGPELKLALQRARSWQATCAAELQRGYGARSAEEGWSLLREWFGVSQPKQKWPLLPGPLSGALHARLADDLRREAVETSTDFFATLLGRATPIVTLRLAAQVCGEYLLNNPGDATRERIQRLERYVEYDSWQKLVTLNPPEEPGLPDWQFDSLSDWFTTKYLPYRNWALSSGSDSGGWIATCATAFAHQYLEYYTMARTGGDGASHLAWAKSGQLTNPDPSAEGKCMQLLVILDGLTYPDARRLSHWIREESSRLSLDAEALALSPIPTVTEFAKPAVARGLLPEQALQDQSREDAVRTAYSSADAVKAALQEAKPGDVVIWSHTEPDRTYHFRSSASPDEVRREVEAQLRAIAKHVAAATVTTTDERRLRIILTADHGRLLADAVRSIPVPEGMKAHGRAAWGSSRVRFDESGVTLDGELAYLQAARFGLPANQAYVVILSDKAFLTSDERTGIERFPHGGLFPEEVLVPWFEFARDREPPRLEVTLSGKGEEGKPGKATLAVRNLGQVRIALAKLDLADLEVRKQPDGNVGPLSKKALDVTLVSWPSREAAGSLVAQLTYRLPGGELVVHEFKPELGTESMYERSNILDDLVDL